MKSLISATALLFLTVVACTRTQRVVPEDRDAEVPKPRSLETRERLELAEHVASRFGAKPPVDARYHAAGPFLFVEWEDFLYAERTDVGSFSFERSRYGTDPAGVDTTKLTREVIYRRIDAGLAKVGIDARDREFDGFQDEFAGARPKGGLSIDFDPRKESRLMARTAAYVRRVGGIPVFGSELLIGLMPDGSVGRLRLHWPKVNDAVLAEARRIQEAVRTNQWSLPNMLKANDVTVLDKTAGVAQSSFSDLGFRQRAVVRVLYRVTSADRDLPLVSTRYVYFDAAGNKITLSAYPEIPATPGDQKPTSEKR